MSIDAPDATNALSLLGRQADATITWVPAPVTTSASNVSTAYAVDLATSDNITLLLTLTGNTTLTINNAAAGKALTIVVTQGGAGNFTLTLPGSCKTPGSAAIDWNTAAGSVNVFSMLAISSTYLITTSVKM